MCLVRSFAILGQIQYSSKYENAEFTLVTEMHAVSTFFEIFIVKLCQYWHDYI